MFFDSIFQLLKKIHRSSMIKDILRGLGQKLLGFDNYLFVFSLFNITRMQAGGYEKAFCFFADMISGDGAILDIGANIGAMTVTLAKKHPKSIIYAFEPVALNRKALERVTRFYRLKNVNIFPQALGDENGEIAMIMPRVGASRMQGLSHVIESTAPEKGEVFTVAMQRLDDIHELAAIPKISAVKIDVENFEYFVLKGGEALLRKHQPIVFCELWNNERRALCFAMMNRLGYSVKLFDRGKLTDFKGEDALNFMFLPGVAKI